MEQFTNFDDRGRAHLLLHPHFLSNLKSFFQTLYGTTNVPDSDFHCCTCHMTEVVYSCQILSGITGRLKFRAGMFYFERNHTPMWVSIETNLLVIPINLDIHSASKKKLLRQTKNPFLKNTFMVWHNVLAYLGETTSLS